jgi:hypothetical protein
MLILDLVQYTLMQIKKKSSQIDRIHEMDNLI